MKKRGLGRPLNAILSVPSVSESRDERLTNKASENSNAHQLQDLAIESLQRGQFQPRREMDESALNELAASIKAQGVLQPIIVRQCAANQYEIIAGERRWRAAKIAGLTHVPVVIKDIADEAAMAIGLIENIQRLLQEFDLTHQEVAESVGRSRAAVSNLLRLLNLLPAVQKLVEHGDIEMGHARTLLALPQEKQLSVARHIVERGLSVREAEALVKQLSQNKSIVSKAKPVDASILRLQQSFSDKLRAKVAIQHKSNGKGKVVIQYNSPAELERMAKLLQSSSEFAGAGE